MSCPRHPDGDGPAWCQDCHPETYAQKYGIDLSAPEKFFRAAGRTQEPGRPYCRECRSYFCPHVASYLGDSATGSPENEEV